jgi:hypothetical protein
MKDEFCRWMDKVILPDKKEDCWIWSGTKYRGGYGHFRRFLDNKWTMFKAHRFSYEFYVGQIPKGFCILHSCDNPSCVNPNHLRVGTLKENNQDTRNKGRHSFGRNSKHTHLSLEIAIDIRNQKQQTPKITCLELGQMFNTSAPQVSRILNNKIWKSPEGGL